MIYLLNSNTMDVEFICIIFLFKLKIVKLGVKVGALGEQMFLLSLLLFRLIHSITKAGNQTSYYKAAGGVGGVCGVSTWTQCALADGGG